MDSAPKPKTNLVELLNNLDKDDDTANPLQIMSISNQYFDIDEISGQINTLNNYKLKVLHLNIRSLPDKFDKLKMFLVNCKINLDVLLLCETFLNERNQDLYQLPGYQFICKSRKNRTGGGVGIYLKNHINFKIRDDLAPHTEGSFESILVETLNTNKKYIIGEIYRPPNTSEQLALDNYEQTVIKIQETKLESVLGTDQNFCLLKASQNNKTHDLLNVFFNNSFTPSIILPTRITHSSATLIDNLYVKTTPQNIPKSGVIIADLSDHLPIFVCIGKRRSYTKPNKTIISRQLNDDKLNEIKLKLGTMDWNDLKNMNINDAHNHFISKLNEILDKVAPKKEVKLNNKFQIREKWMTKGLLRSSINKAKLYKKAINKSRDSPQYRNYITYRNLFCKLKRITKSKYYSNQLEDNKNNMKETWKILRSAMNKINDKVRVTQIINEAHEVITNDNEISDSFCNFFSNVGQKLADKIPKSKNKPEHYLKHRANNSIFLVPTDPEEIDKIINGLKPKNSSGHDDINSRFLKYLKNELKEPISILANISISEGIFPEAFKLAEVVPIHKNKAKDDINNYRPISLLPTISKILEKIIHKRVYKFLQKNKILYSSQYGFRPKHSTNDAIAELITDITNNIEDKSNTLSLFLDLSKAFDTIDHKILLTKLKHYGIRGSSLSWFESYLTNRMQYVKINNTKSVIKKVSCGVPQGSVLGPLLFIIYTNDLPNSLNHTHPILFADDTTIYTKSNNLITLFENVNSDLNNLYDWFNVNKLSLNISKTNYMISTTNIIPEEVLNRLEIKIGSQKIDRKQHVKFLGIFLDENLNWKQHITSTINKISKIGYSIRMIKNILPKQNLKTLYQTLIQPHFVYGITFWGGTYDTYLNKLFVQQKKLIRIITNSKYNEHTDPLFNELKLLKLSELHKLYTAKLMYKASRCQLPEPINVKYKPNTMVHSHNTRQINDPHVRHRRTQIASNQINHTGPHIWQHLPVKLKNANHIKHFTKYYTQFLIETRN